MRQHNIPYNKFEKEVYRLAKKNQLTLAELASAVGISYFHLTNLLRLKVQISYEYLDRLDKELAGFDKDKWTLFCGLIPLKWIKEIRRYPNIYKLKLTESYVNTKREATDERELKKQSRSRD